MGYDTMTCLKQLNAVLRYNRTGVRVEAYSVEHLVELAYFNKLLLCGYLRAHNRELIWKLLPSQHVLKPQKLCML